MTPHVFQVYYFAVDTAVRYQTSDYVVLSSKLWTSQLPGQTLVQVSWCEGRSRSVYYFWEGLNRQHEGSKREGNNQSYRYHIAMFKGDSDSQLMGVCLVSFFEGSLLEVSQGVFSVCHLSRQKKSTSKLRSVGGRSLIKNEDIKVDAAVGVRVRLLSCICSTPLLAKNIRLWSTLI